MLDDKPHQREVAMRMSARVPHGSPKELHEDPVCPSSDPLEFKLQRFNQENERAHWRVVYPPPQVAHELYIRGRGVLAEAGPMLLAICLNNGYYNRQRIHHLVHFAARFSDSPCIFFTDGPAVHNYLALGDNLIEARAKARKQKRRLENACIEAMGSCKIRPRIINWNEIYARRDYIERLTTLKALHETNREFATAVNSETRNVLSRLSRATDESVEIAAQYTLEELAFLQIYANVAMSTHGRAQFSYVYHVRWPLLEDVVSGRYTGERDTNIGQCLIKIDMW